MIQKIKRCLLIAATSLMIAVPTVGVVTTATAAACKGTSTGIAEGVDASLAGSNADATTCANDNSVNDQGIKNLAKKVTNTFSIIVGAASVIMIIYGGFRYITSGGESSRVGAAKNSLLYAIVGLVIVALAQLIIHFVLSQSQDLTSGSAFLEGVRSALVG
jgi:hypothetical protein